MAVFRLMNSVSAICRFVRPVATRARTSCSRAVSPSQAAAWGVYLHGEAGNRLTQRLGFLGFLPRELPREIPPILAAIEQETLR